jgi:hypothetical protein
MKKVVVIILILALLLALAACGGGDPGSDTGSLGDQGDGILSGEAGTSEGTESPITPEATPVETPEAPIPENMRILYADNEETIPVYTIVVPEGVTTEFYGRQVKLIASNGEWKMQISASVVDPEKSNDETFIMKKTRMEGTVYELTPFHAGEVEGFYYQSSNTLIELTFPSLISDDENAPYGTMGLFGPFDTDGNYIDGDVVQFLDDQDVQAILGSIRAPG